MNVPCVVVILLVCFKGVLGNDCGNINYSQPAFKGRNVTLFYKPIEFSFSEKPTFFYIRGTNWKLLSSTIVSNLTSGVFTTVFDTKLSNVGQLYAKYGSCYSETIHLNLQDLSGGCGYIYLRTPNPVVGKNVEIGYYPAPAVIGLTGEYSREWYNESSRSLMTLTEGLLTEEELPNKEFVLTIYNSTRWTTGNYSVKCTKSTTNRLSTERVYVKVTVPPGQPFLQSPNIVQDCPKCLVGILHENLYYHVFCNTSGGTTPSIYVGDEGGTVYNDTQFENIYKISRIIREEDHMKTVTCSVSNAALENPLTTSAKFFVAVKPEVPVLNVPILRDGNPANITCISRGGRPATNLSLWLDEANYSVDHVKTYKTYSTRTYSTILTFNNPARKDWNRKFVSCVSSSPLFGKTVTQQKTLNCISSTQKTYEIPNESEDASLTNRNGIPIVWIVIGLSVIIAVVIISTVIVLARKRFLKKNHHANSSEPQPVQHANVQGNETVEMNEEVTYAQVNKVRTNRTETLGPKTKGSDTNLVYADIDIEHLETASKPPSRERPPSPTEYAEIHTIRTERGSNSDNIITSSQGK
ncbi:tyrosine-protein phosphatase non-receptor type substrate 1-like isoform X2 [Mya arenaria]|uniref:tyrosine-protein phosphatase non-receptor type substrate 1-like isoform X2 n=1 Tax=Mya arenaria TaxID=6604 RepID=UPI0022E854DC|nr:tyrosine-protein phosphatase non-receptor type substrate 1-like isoform X2 [Mya arenaria]